MTEDGPPEAESDGEEEREGEEESIPAPGTEGGQERGTDDGEGQEGGSGDGNEAETGSESGDIGDEPLGRSSDAGPGGTPSDREPTDTRDGAGESGGDSDVTDRPAEAESEEGTTRERGTDPTVDNGESGVSGTSGTSGGSGGRAGPRTERDPDGFRARGEKNVGVDVEDEGETEAGGGGDERTETERANRSEAGEVGEAVEAGEGGETLDGRDGRTETDTGDRSEESGEAEAGQGGDEEGEAGNGRDEGGDADIRGDERGGAGGSGEAGNAESGVTGESATSETPGSRREPESAPDGRESSPRGRGSDPPQPAGGPGEANELPADVRSYDRFQKVDRASYDRVNEFLRDRTYVTAREWAIARLCADFRTATGVEMTKIGENLPELVPFMTDTYSPQAVNQARSAFEEKVRMSGATFLYGAMSGFFTADELDDLMYEVTEVAKFLLEVEGVELTVDEELDAEDRISAVMREVRRASEELRYDEVACPHCEQTFRPDSGED